jgi:hypothetical protein
VHVLGLFTAFSGRLVGASRRARRAAAPYALSSLSLPPVFSRRGSALGATSVYWTADTTGSAGEGVFGVPYGGGAVTTLATGQLGPLAIAADTANVYWANWGSYEEAHNGSIASVPSSGGTVTTLAAERNDPISIAVDDSYVYWTDWGENAWSNGAVLRVPKTGGAIVTLASKRNDPASIVVAAGTVFFIDTMGLESVPAAGGMVTTVLAGGALGYAVDEGNLYWVASPGTILTQPLAGGPTTTLATTSSFAGPMAVGPFLPQSGRSGEVGSCHGVITEAGSAHDGAHAGSPRSVYWLSEARHRAC